MLEDSTSGRKLPLWVWWGMVFAVAVDAAIALGISSPLHRLSSLVSAPDMPAGFAAREAPAPSAAEATDQSVLIKPGGFLMGSSQDSPDGANHPDEQPAHWVSLGSAFRMSKLEVTFDEYDAFAASTGRALPNDEGWGRGNRPVINITWQDAQAYADWLSAQTGHPYRLPTEAEWEYAARQREHGVLLGRRGRPQHG